MAAPEAAGPPPPPYWDVPLELGQPIPEDRRCFLRLHQAPAPSLQGEAGPHGTAVIIHGGYWKNRFGLDDEYGNAGTASLAPYFLQRGFGAVELEYRRRDHEGGGWPGTNHDVLAALRALAGLRALALEGGAALAAAGGVAASPALGGEGLEAMRSLRPDRLILVGHSAGGCLALWAAHHLCADPEATGDSQAALVVACAPVADLMRGHEMRVSDEGDAVELYMKCRPDSEEARAQYARASPAALLPARCPVLVAYGDQDTDVPPELVAGYARAAQASAPGLVREVMVAGADHFDVVNAASAAWTGSIAPAVADLAEGCLGTEAATALRS